MIVSGKFLADFSHLFLGTKKRRQGFLPTSFSFYAMKYRYFSFFAAWRSNQAAAPLSIFNFKRTQKKEAGISPCLLRCYATKDLSLHQK